MSLSPSLKSLLQFLAVAAIVALGVVAIDSVLLAPVAMDDVSSPPSRAETWLQGASGFSHSKG